jgi:hypothetical protein
MLAVEMICSGLVPELAGKVTEKFTAGGKSLGGIAGQFNPKSIADAADKRRAAEAAAAKEAAKNNQ